VARWPVWSSSPSYTWPICSCRVPEAEAPGLAVHFPGIAAPGADAAQCSYRQAMAWLECRARWYRAYALREREAVRLKEVASVGWELHAVMLTPPYTARKVASRRTTHRDGVRVLLHRAGQRLPATALQCRDGVILVVEGIANSRSPRSSAENRKQPHHHRQDRFVEHGLGYMSQQPRLWS